MDLVYEFLVRSLTAHLRSVLLFLSSLLFRFQFLSARAVLHGSGAVFHNFVVGDFGDGDNVVLLCVRPSDSRGGATRDAQGGFRVHLAPGRLDGASELPAVRVVRRRGKGRVLRYDVARREGRVVAGMRGRRGHHVHPHVHVLRRVRATDLQRDVLDVHILLRRPDADLPELGQ